MKICISEKEFRERAAKLNQKMREMDLDAVLVYGDEYRKENLRYFAESEKEIINWVKES